MKKFCTITLALLTLGLLLTVGSGPAKAASPQNGKINIVCTTFPQYDWVRQILGDRADGAELTLLLDSGVDLHSFQPTADDMIRIYTSDLFIYVGGESDEWVKNALKGVSNPNRVAINLLETLGSGAKTEDVIEGMEEEEDHGHEAEDAHEEEAAHDEHEDEEEHASAEEHEEHEGEEAHSHEGEEVYDEHVWLSLKNAAVFCTAITDALSSLDAGNAETYRNNLAAYKEQLAALDAKYQAATSAAPVRTLLFGDRFPFRYLVDDYGLTYYAAFPGCSAETEASFETIVFLANKVDETGLKNVMALEGADQAIAKTIIGNTKGKNQRILTLDSLQSVTARNVEEGASYLSIMENNLGVLKEALQ